MREETPSVSHHNEESQGVVAQEEEEERRISLSQLAKNPVAGAAMASTGDLVVHSSRFERDLMLCDPEMVLGTRAAAEMLASFWLTVHENEHKVFKKSVARSLGFLKVLPKKMRKRAVDELCGSIFLASLTQDWREVAREISSWSKLATQIEEDEQ